MRIFPSNVRTPMVPLGSSGVGLKEKRLIASSGLALTQAASLAGSVYDRELDDVMLIDDAADWHNNHAEDPATDTLVMSDTVAINMEMLRPTSSTLTLVDHVHAALDGYHPPDGESELALDVIAGEDVYQGAPAYVVSNNTVNLASAADGTKAKAIGFIVQGASANQATIVQTDGCVDLDDWSSVIGTANLTPGSTYFLSTTAGQMSTTPPTGDGQVVVTLGMAVTTKCFDIEINEIAVL
jgi:hypothetical protein